MPAVTTFSPGDNPRLITTEVCIELEKLNGPAVHLAVLAHHPDLWPVSRLQEGGRGEAHDLLALDFDATNHNGAQAHLQHGGDGRVTFTWYVPVVLSASGEISRIEPVTVISGRP